MIHYVYCYRDKKLGYFQKPIFTTEDLDHFKIGAIRAVKSTPQESVGMVKDLSLYYIGTFDDEKGVLIPLDHEEKILDCEDYFVKEGA